MGGGVDTHPVSAICRARGVGLNWRSVVGGDRHVRQLSIEEPTARAWGELQASRRWMGRPLVMEDGLIASTAIVRRLVLATRNVGDFADCGVLVVNPWKIVPRPKGGHLANVKENEIP